jgi:hypothetical protein
LPVCSCGAPVNAIFGDVLRLYRAAEIGAVNFLVVGAVERDLALFGLDRLA